jgi:DNA polymerase III alpha subunit (gram-positive type)
MINEEVVKLSSSIRQFRLVIHNTKFDIEFWTTDISSEAQLQALNIIIGTLLSWNKREKYERILTKLLDNCLLQSVAL